MLAGGMETFDGGFECGIFGENFCYECFVFGPLGDFDYEGWSDWG